MTTRKTNRDLDPDLRKALWELSSEERESLDAWGNGFYWASLNSPELLPAAAKLLAETDARLCMVTALSRFSATDPIVFVEYHFDVNGHTVTLIVHLNKEETDQNAEIPTITPWFRNADWHEREFSELYGVKVKGNANPKRLFLDSSIEEGVLKGLVPLTVMMNGACTKDMWERVMEANQEKTAGEEA